MLGVETHGQTYNMVKFGRTPNEGTLGRANKHMKCNKKTGKGKKQTEVLPAIVVDPKEVQLPIKETPNLFEKKLEQPCPNHTFPVKHLYKDCGLKRRFFSGPRNGRLRGILTPTKDDVGQKVEDKGFLEPDGFM